MTLDGYRYSFDPQIPITEVRYSILLSALAAEGVHGRTQVLLDAAFRVDEVARTCTVDASTPVGRTISQVFTSLLTREFGELAFSTERVSDTPEPDPVRRAGIPPTPDHARGDPTASAEDRQVRRGRPRE